MGCPGTPVGGLIQRVSYLLGDQGVGCGFTRFPKHTLVDFMNEALCALSGLRPDAFTELTDLPLQPGSVQTLPGCYDALLDIKQDSSRATAGKVDDYYTQVLRGKRCRSEVCCSDASGYTMASYSLHTNDAHSFSVSPPVPDGREPVVKAIVVRKAGVFCPADEAKDLGIDCKWIAPVIEFVLYRALSMEVDSARSVEVAQNHLRNFYTLVDKGYLYEQRSKSGYWAGQVGAGDPTFRNR